MATQLSESFRKMAVDMVNVFGKSGYAIRRETKGPKDPNKPTDPGPVQTEDFICSAAVTDYDIKQIDGVQVLRGDQQVILAITEGLLEDIRPGDLFVDGDKVWNIIPPVSPVEVNGARVVYILQVRR